MKYRKLGSTGLEVSEVGFGAWAIGGWMWGGADDAVSLRALDRAIDCGVNFIDTAIVYGQGRSERLCGEVVRRHQSASKPVLIATKVPPKDSYWPARHESLAVDIFPKAHMIASCEKSLRNLNVECIDLLQLHVWAPDWARQDEWRKAFDELQGSGKIRFAGISLNDHEPDTALDVVSKREVDVVQVIYNVFDQSPDDALLSACAKAKVGVLARVPLDEGSLTGKLTLETRFSPSDFRTRYFAEHRLQETVERVEALRPDLEVDGGSMAEGALRFCLSSPAVSSVIPGMRNEAQVDANLRASDLGPLCEDTRRKLKRHRWVRNFYKGLHDG